MNHVDSLFAPPTYDAGKVKARQASLPPQLRERIRRAGAAFERGDIPTARRSLAEALAIDANQPDALRFYGLLMATVGNRKRATTYLDAALRAAPDDALGYWRYARARDQAGETTAALRIRQLAVKNIPQSPLAWLDLGTHLYKHQSVGASLGALERAVALAPLYGPGLLQLADAYVSCGRIDDGAALIRRALVQNPAFGAAWIALLDIKTLTVTENEITQMRQSLTITSRSAKSERTATAFALAAACERIGRYREAWRLVAVANARRKGEVRPWPQAEFLEEQHYMNCIAQYNHAPTPDSTLGREVIFIVGMPRSGTTLIEQILAAHPMVHPAGELPFMRQVIAEESTRRSQRYPEWLMNATSDDWQRLGQRYLQLTLKFRRDRPVSTDKLPENWRLIGAIHAMLPGARILICRRDPLENCWSCFKQYFTHGFLFSYDIKYLAYYWRAFDHTASRWSARAPDRIRQQSYEVLTTHSDTEIRSILDFCQLPFDSACLHFNDVHRTVRTLSAAQVREPIHRYQLVTPRYGALINPLRAALGIPALERSNTTNH